MSERHYLFNRAFIGTASLPDSQEILPSSTSAAHMTPSECTRQCHVSVIECCRLFSSTVEEPMNATVNSTTNLWPQFRLMFVFILSLRLEKQAWRSAHFVSLPFDVSFRPFTHTLPLSEPQETLPSSITVVWRTRRARNCSRSVVEEAYLTVCGHMRGTHPSSFIFFLSSLPSNNHCECSLSVHSSFKNKWFSLHRIVCAFMSSGARMRGKRRCKESGGEEWVKNSWCLCEMSYSFTAKKMMLLWLKTCRVWWTGTMQPIRCCHSSAD